MLLLLYRTYIVFILYLYVCVYINVVNITF